MSKSDLEIEDAEKLPNDSRNNLQESKSKMVDANVESKGEKLPCAAAVSGDVTGSEREDGGKGLNKCRNEEKDNTGVNTEVKDQTNHKSEANEEESVHEQISTKSGNEELVNTKIKAEEPTGPRSALETQTNAGNGVVEQKAANGGMEMENSMENDMDDGNHVKYGVVEQKAANGGMENENSTENDMEDGDHVQNVKEKPNEDVAEKNPEKICKLNPDDVEHVLLGEKITENAYAGNRQLPTNETPQRQEMELDEIQQDDDVEMKDAANLDKEKPVKHDLIEQGAETVLHGDVEMKDAANLDKEKPVKHDLIEQGAETVLHRETDGNDQTVVIAAKHDGEDALHANQPEDATPNSLVRFSSVKAGDCSGETFKTAFTQPTVPLMGEGDGTPEDQVAFMKELESFYREKAMDFKPPKFYGQPLNCLKLWRAVIRLGGYDTVTGAKLWRQVGESFHPPKTCTTVSWTFRIFYEKSLLEYERHKTQSGELQLPVRTAPEVSGVDGEGSGYQGSGTGRAKRDAAARAMQGWHVQRISGHGEVGEPIIKDKNLCNMAKREKNFKSIGSLKQKRPNEMDHSNKVARTEIFKQLVTSVVDVGPPADWVKINVRQTKECFEVYALVPGLLREEVRVQSDPAGRLVITGQPEQVDNPWGITPFKKVISLPARIDPLETSAVVSLHGRLFVRVPFEGSNN